MNPNEYDTRYSGSYRPGRTPYHRGAPSVAPSSRNDYDVESLLSARSLPQRDYSHWGRRPDTDNYDRRSEYTQAHPQYMRVDSPLRHRSTYRDSSYDKLEPPPRREYSPIRKVDNELDSSFKGFTTPLPGNDPGYIQEQIDNPRLRRYRESERSSIRDYSSTLPSNDSYINKEPKQRYRENRNRNVFDDDYPSEPMRHGSSIKSKYEEPIPERYSRDFPLSSKKCEPEYHRSWESASSYWDNEACQPGQHVNEQALSPQTFKRECQKAYKEARAQRMRNLEEGLYGKCDWATFDISLKHLGDDLNCQRCFEESLKQNENDVEARINYVLFLYLKNNRQLAMKHYSHFQQVLSVTSNIDKELISMGNALAGVLNESEKLIDNPYNSNDTQMSDGNNQKDIEIKDEKEFREDDDDQDKNFENNLEHVNSDTLIENETDTDDLV